MLSAIELVVAVVVLGGELVGISGIVLTPQTIDGRLEYQLVVSGSAIAEVSEGLLNRLTLCGGVLLAFDPTPDFGGHC